MHVHTCCVLTNPRIPSSPCNIRSFFMCVLICMYMRMMDLCVCACVRVGVYRRTLPQRLGTWRIQGFEFTACPKASPQSQRAPCLHGGGGGPPASGALGWDGADCQHRPSHIQGCGLHNLLDTTTLGNSQDSRPCFTPSCITAATN